MNLNSFFIAYRNYILLSFVYQELKQRIEAQRPDLAMVVIEQELNCQT